MRIISKVIANTIRELMIVENNIEILDDYCEKRIISDNILVAHEVMHIIKRTRKSDNGFMGIKIDMSKTYDRG